MLSRKSLLIAFILFCSLLFAPKVTFALTASNEPIATPAEVVVVYNTAYVVDGDTNGTQDSQQIANYYKTARNIPDNNIIGLSATTTEIITRAIYNAEIKAPLETELLNRGLASTTKYIVLIKGMPLKIRDSDPAVIDFGVYGQTDYSSVDSAITLLFQTYTNVWTINNPYLGDPGFSTKYRFKNGFYSNGAVTLNYLVTRLDGYTVGNVLTMIDNALLAPSSGGDVFLLDDITSISCDNMSGAHAKLKNYNANLIPAVWSGSDQIVTTTLPTVAYTSYGRHSALGANYYGTYLNDMDWSPGAVTATYESFNAYSFDITKRLVTDHGQVADFIESGGSGGIGNVYEPWCSAIAEESTWMSAYKLGYTWADSAYMSLSYLDFVTVVVGDPLMRILDDNNLSPYKTNAMVRTMAYSQDNGNLYIGGDFTLVSDINRNYLAEIDTTSGTSTARNFLVDGPVYSMLIDGNILYIGGNFSSVLGQARSNIASINLLTGQLTDFNITLNGLVNAMVIKDSVLYIGGEFSFVNSQSKNYLAAVNVSTNQLVSFSFPTNNVVRSLAFNGNILYVGGSFTTINSQTRNLLAAIDVSANTLLPFSFDITGGVINSLLFDQNRLYVGGSFTIINQQPYKYLAVINTSTNGLVTKNFQFTGAGGSVKTLVKKNGQVYIGGQFTGVLGQTRGNVASFAIGSYVLSDFNHAVDGPVYALDISTNKYFIGGSFAAVDLFDKYNLYSNDYFSIFFDQTSTLVDSAQTLQIPVSLSKLSATDVTFNYVSAGTAAYGIDYTITGGASGTVTIPAGQLSKNFTVQILTTINSRKSFTITLSQPNTGSIVSPEHTVNIINYNSGLALSKESLTVHRLTSPDTYTISLTQQPTDPVTVTVAVRNSTYSSSTPTALTFTSDNWNQAQTVSVQAKNVSLPQSSYLNYLDYSIVSDDLLYNDLPATSTPVTVYDNVVVNFSSSSSSANENQSVSSNVLVDHSYISDISIPYSVSSSAVYGSEYMVTGGQQGNVILLAGQTSVQLPVSILNLLTNQRIILVTLGTPSYGVLGTSTSFLVVATKATTTSTTGGSSSGGGGGGGGAAPVSVPTVPSTTLTPTINNNQTSNNGLAVSVSKLEFDGKDVFFVNPNKAEDIISHLNLKKDDLAESKAKTQIEADAKEFKVKLADNESQKASLFVAYGIDGVSKALGAGERRAVVRDYLETTSFSEINWDDVVRMSQGVKPVKRNIVNEREHVKEALPVFKKLYGSNPNFKNPDHDLAWNVLLYRIRFQRDLAKEKKGITTFRQLYKRAPTTPFDWSIVRASGYVK